MIDNRGEEKQKKPFGYKCLWKCAVGNWALLGRKKTGFQRVVAENACQRESDVYGKALSAFHLHCSLNLKTPGLITLPC